MMTRFCFTFLYLVIYCFDWWNKHAAREKKRENICRRNSIQMISAQGILLFNELDEIKNTFFFHSNGNGKKYIFPEMKSNLDCLPRRPPFLLQNFRSMNNESKICVSNAERRFFYYSWRFNAVTEENKQENFSDENLLIFQKSPQNFLLRFLFTIILLSFSVVKYKKTKGNKAARRKTKSMLRQP